MPGRIRTIKPEFFLDEDVAALDPLDRVAFIGLLCYADKAGRLENRPSRLAAMVLPYEQKGFEARISRLVVARFLIPYENDGRQFLQIRTFSAHQRPHHTEPESKIPSPDSSGSVVMQPLHNGDVTPETLSKNRLVGDTTVVSREGKEGKGRDTGEGKGKHQSRTTSSLDGFSDFWSRYPKKIGKGAAEHVWARLGTSERKAVMEAVIRFSEEWSHRPTEDRQFCPHPATWLNQKRWQDEGFVEAPPPPLTPEEAEKEKERQYWADRLAASEEEEKRERSEFLARLKADRKPKEAENV